MILNTIFWILAICISGTATGLILYFCEFYQYWYGILSGVLIGIVAIPFVWALIFIVWLLLAFIVSLFLKLEKEVKKPSRVAYWITFQTNWILCHIACKITVINKEKVPRDSRFLIVYNHRSNFDPMLLMSEFINYEIIYITKPENFNTPIMGSFIRKSGFIPINRNDSREGLKTILKSIDLIKNDKCSIAIAPEGTRNKTLEKPLLDFHPGSFKIAYKAQVPIVVACITNTEKIHKRFPRRTKVTVEIMETIPYDDYKDKTTVELSKELHEQMLEHITKEAN